MSDTGPEFPSDHVLRQPFRHRRPLRQDLQRAHAHASAELGGIDAELEALLRRRRGCLGELDQLRTALNRRWTHHHVRRWARVDEAPMPPAPPGAEPLDGTDLRAVCVTLLRRHGPQDLRALHGLLHCYGYVVGGVRPVQRLGDAMAYEARSGRTTRIARGVYAACSDDDPPRPSWSGPSPHPTSPLPWNRPVTDPAPPLVDPPVAHDPEHWSGGHWPGGDDDVLERPEQGLDDAGPTAAVVEATSGPVEQPPMRPASDAPTTDGSSPDAAVRADPPATATTANEVPGSSPTTPPIRPTPPAPPAPPPPSTALGDDSSTNRPRGVEPGVGVDTGLGANVEPEGPEGDVGTDAGPEAGVRWDAGHATFGADAGSAGTAGEGVGPDAGSGSGRIERLVGRQRWRRRSYAATPRGARASRWRRRAGRDDPGGGG